MSLNTLTSFAVHYSLSLVTQWVTDSKKRTQISVFMRHRRSHKLLAAVDTAVNSSSAEINIWEHPHDVDISVPYSVLCFSSQLSFLCLRFRSTHQIRLQLFLRHTSEQCSLSLANSSLCSALQNRALLHITAVLSRSLYLCLASKAALFRAPASGTNSASHTYRLC